MGLAMPGLSSVRAGGDGEQGQGLYHGDLVCAIHPPTHGGARNGGVLKLQSNTIALRLNGMHLHGMPGSKPFYHLT